MMRLNKPFDKAGLEELELFLTPEELNANFQEISSSRKSPANNKTVTIDDICRDEFWANGTRGHFKEKEFLLGGKSIRIVRIEKSDPESKKSVSEFHLIGKTLGKGAVGTVSVALVLNEESFSFLRQPSFEMPAHLIKADKFFRANQTGIDSIKHEEKILAALNKLQGASKIPHKKSGSENLILSMEWVQGVNLSGKNNSVLKEFLDLPAALKIYFYAKIAIQLQELHNKIIYRDLKPGNIVIDIDNRAVSIIDFGSSALNANVESYAPFTTNYAPMEVLSGDTYTQSADLFAFYITILELSGVTLLTNIAATVDKINKINWKNCVRHDPSKNLGTYLGISSDDTDKILAVSTLEKKLIQGTSDDPEQRPTLSEIIPLLLKTAKILDPNLNLPIENLIAKYDLVANLDQGILTQEDFPSDLIIGSNIHSHNYLHALIEGLDQGILTKEDLPSDLLIDPNNIGSDNPLTETLTCQSLKTTDSMSMSREQSSRRSSSFTSSSITASAGSKAASSRSLEFPQEKPIDQGDQKEPSIEIQNNPESSIPPALPEPKKKSIEEQKALQVETLLLSSEYTKTTFFYNDKANKIKHTVNKEDVLLEQHFPDGSKRVINLLAKAKLNNSNDSDWITTKNEGLKILRSKLRNTPLRDKETINVYKRAIALWNSSEEIHQDEQASSSPNDLINKIITGLEEYLKTVEATLKSQGVFSIFNVLLNKQKDDMVKLKKSVQASLKEEQNLSTETIHTLTNLPHCSVRNCIAAHTGIPYILLKNALQEPHRIPQFSVEI